MWLVLLAQTTKINATSTVLSINLYHLWPQRVCLKDLLFQRTRLKWKDIFMIGISLIIGWCITCPFFIKVIIIILATRSAPTSPLCLIFCALCLDQNYNFLKVIVFRRKLIALLVDCIIESSLKLYLDVRLLYYRNTWVSCKKEELYVAGYTFWVSEYVS